MHVHMYSALTNYTVSLHVCCCTSDDHTINKAIAIDVYSTTPVAAQFWENYQFPLIESFVGFWIQAIYSNNNNQRHHQRFSMKWDLQQQQWQKMRVHVFHILYYRACTVLLFCTFENCPTTCLSMLGGASWRRGSRAGRWPHRISMLLRAFLALRDTQSVQERKEKK